MPPVLRDNFNYSGFLITNKKNRETKLINFMQLMRSSYPAGQLLPAKYLTEEA